MPKPVANVLPVNMRTGEFAVGFGCGVLHLGWRSFTWMKNTYVFRMGAYLIIENKVFEDIRVGTGWVVLRACLEEGNLERPPPPQPTRTMVCVPRRSYHLRVSLMSEAAATHVIYEHQHPYFGPG